jgi:hypothetical protein
VTTLERAGARDRRRTIHCGYQRHGVPVARRRGEPRAGRVRSVGEGPKAPARARLPLGRRTDLEEP